MRKRRSVRRIYGMKYCWKGQKDRNRYKNRIKRGRQAQLVLVFDIVHNIPTTWRWARGDWNNGRHFIYMHSLQAHAIPQLRPPSKSMKMCFKSGSVLGEGFIHFTWEYEGKGFRKKMVLKEVWSLVRSLANTIRRRNPESQQIFLIRTWRIWKAQRSE